MKKIQLHRFIRKSHRYLGLILGIQFLAWTIGGLYFSWTNIEEIRGDHLKKEKSFLNSKDLSISPADAISKNLKASDSIISLSLEQILDKQYYQVCYISENRKHIALIDTKTAELRPPLSEKEAIEVARASLNKKAFFLSAEYLTSAGKHHEYREKPLPAYAVTFDKPVQTTVYVSTEMGTVQSFRSTQWRVFDFLWMLHTMDYQERDNFNNYLLRAFSLFGIFTILSGFFLFYITSKNRRRKRK